MEFLTQWRLTGDEYGAGYGNGITLADGESVLSSEKIKSDENETVFRGKHGHLVRCLHENKNGVWHCRSVFENVTGKPARLELLSSFAIKGLKADRIHRATSFWSAEGKLLSQDLTDLDMERSWANHGMRIEKFGQTGSMPVLKWFPFLALEDSEKSEFLGVQLYVSASWQIEVYRRDESISVQGGLADRDFGAWSKDVMPGEKFETPKAVIATGHSLEEVCDKLVKAQDPHIAEVDRDMPVIFNEYCTTWGNPTLENLEKTAKRLEGTGVRYLVIDSGWYRTETCKDWFCGAGDWEPSRELFPDGIKEAADVIRSHGLIPGLWFEYECLGSASKAWNENDHVLKRDGFPVNASGRKFWNMTDPWVWEYLDSRVVKLLKEAGFGYIKIDYNANTGAGVDGAESYGEGLRCSAEESVRYMKHLGEEIPGLVIENCASGGHRLTPAFMENSSMSSFSDAHECNSIPLIAANLHRVIRPEQSQIWAVLRASADIHRINFLLSASFLGRLCLSGEIFDLDEEKWGAALSAIGFYGKVSHIIKDGYTKSIRANVRDYTKPEGYQAVLRTLNNEALLIVHTFENGKNPPIEDFFTGYDIVEEFGSALDGDFRGHVFLLKEKRK
ncbi:MAG: alpha-galactosidase [Lachnospiraceae bacterium]|nr:alpha-galactosidase [Lachnospiraceae bacterium]